MTKLVKWLEEFKKAGLERTFCTVTAFTDEESGDLEWLVEIGVEGFTGRARSSDVESAAVMARDNLLKDFGETPAIFKAVKKVLKND